MRDRPDDVPYCGVDVKKIRERHPVLCEETLETLTHYISERYSVHLKKDVLGLEPPYTDDEIVSHYRFTNVRREHDRETRWLIEHIVRSDLSLRDRVLNIILFRAYNSHTTAEILELPLVVDDMDIDSLAERVRGKRRLWNSAFFTSGIKGALRYYVPAGGDTDVNVRPLYMIKQLSKTDLVERAIDAGDQKSCYETLLEIKGFSCFMAYQVFVDLTYLDEFRFSENEFTVLGPGARCGLDFLVPDRDGLTYEETLFWLRDNLDSILSSRGLPNPALEFTDLEPEERHMNIMSLENCMCELSKYVKISRGEGRRRVYHPTDK